MGMADNEMMARYERAAEWHMRLADTDFDVSDEQMLRSWLADPVNYEAFETVCAQWNHVGMLTELPEFSDMRNDAVQSLEQARNRTRQPGAFGRLYALADAHKYGAFPAAAAIALMLIAASYLLLQDPVQHFETGIAERQVAMLDDGSQISLDGDSDVDVKMGDNRRELELLEGRANFNVAHDPLRPFTVRARDSLIVATGTSFSVELLKDRVAVTLYEGHVEILKLHDQSGLKPAESASRSEDYISRTLKPGMSLSYTSAGRTIQLQQVNPQSERAWESGQLVFDNVPLDIVVQRINRYSEKPVILAQSRLGTLRVSGVYNHGDIGAFIEGVTAILPVRADNRKDRLILRAR